MVERIAAGNWKMNGVCADLAALAQMATAVPPAITGLICPPATLLSRAAVAVAHTPLHLGGQDCHGAASGAHTGDISAAMIADAGGRFVIMGHSERRSDYGEQNADIAAKVAAAAGAGLRPIVCVGKRWHNGRRVTPCPWFWGNWKDRCRRIWHRQPSLPMNPSGPLVRARPPPQIQSHRCMGRCATGVLVCLAMRGPPCPCCMGDR